MNVGKFAVGRHVMLRKGAGWEGPYKISEVHKSKKPWTYDLDLVDGPKEKGKKGVLVGKLRQPESKGS